MEGVVNDMKIDAKRNHNFRVPKPRDIIKVLLLTVCSSTIAQQEIIINGQGTDRLHDNIGVPEQVYEAWQGKYLLDIDTSDVNGNYLLKIFQYGVATSSSDHNEYKLSSNYPEPYTEQTKLDLTIPDNTTIKIDIFNILGQRVVRQRSFSVFPGNYWMDIKGLFTNGIYFVRVTSPEHSMVEKTIRLDEHSNVSSSQLNKQAPNNFYNDPSITLTKGMASQRMNRIDEELTIKVRGIGLIQYEDDEVTTTFTSQILDFERIQIGINKAYP